ncbi:MAG: hypothetical protein R3F46_14095 [bacterium]
MSDIMQEGHHADPQLFVPCYLAGMLPVQNGQHLAGDFHYPDGMRKAGMVCSGVSQTAESKLSDPAQALHFAGVDQLENQAVYVIVFQLNDIVNRVPEHFWPAGH